MGLGSSVTGVSEPCWLVVSYSVGLSGEGGLCDGFGSGVEGYDTACRVPGRGWGVVGGVGCLERGLVLRWAGVGCRPGGGFLGC